MSLSPRVLQYGVNEPLVEPVELSAGPLDLVFDRGDLRFIRLGQREIVRRVYFAVRDRNWGTIPCEISELKVQRGKDGFAVSYLAAQRAPGIDFRWTVAIIGEPGRIGFQLDGKAHSTFLRNRIGLCVHHPLEGCAGQPCRVEHMDGKVTDGVFPADVSPHQPFLNIRAIRHTVQPGVFAEVRLEGDTFEMEDHRNWTDASFKTYCTPLSLPFPVEVKEGEAVRQSFTLTVTGAPKSPAAPRPSYVTLSLPKGSPAALPALGIGAPSHGRPASETERKRLGLLHVAHVRAEASQIEAAAALALPFEAVIKKADDIDAFAGRSLARALVFDPALLAAAKKRLACPVFGGTDANFAELNRNRPPLDAIDGATFSINPQVHAFDLVSLTENLAAQQQAIESGRRYFAGKVLAVSPVTLKARFNPVATGDVKQDPNELPSAVDPRQMSLYAAAWTALSLKYLALGGAGAVTYYETTGWRGVMETAEGAPLPGKFPSIPGGVFPLFHVLAAIAEFKGGGVIPITSDQPLLADALLIASGKLRRMIVANFTPQARVVRLPSTAPSMLVKHLNDSNAERAMREPESFRAEGGAPLRDTKLELRPFALARLDWTL
ncbi:MAG: hypothetical protein SFV54_05765 [Bryobacteraceae bacterium]|nr:hypothetical protein [Bryobacteraceae bacterium]